MSNEKRYTVVWSTVYMTPVNVSANTLDDSIAEAAEKAVPSENGIISNEDQSVPLMGGVAAVIDKKEGTVRFVKNGFMIDRIMKLAITDLIKMTSGSLGEIKEIGPDDFDTKDIAIPPNSWSPPPLPEHDDFDAYNPGTWKKRPQ